MWNGVVPDGCRRLYKKGEEWQCFFGHKLYSTLTSEFYYKNRRNMRRRASCLILLGDVVKMRQMSSFIEGSSRQ